jgi:hypothetical protein
MDHNCYLAYQLTVAPSSEMMNGFARVVSLPPNEAIAASKHMRKLCGSESPKYFGGGGAIY